MCFSTGYIVRVQVVFLLFIYKNLIRGQVFVVKVCWQLSSGRGSLNEVFMSNALLVFHPPHAILFTVNLNCPLL